MSRLDFIVDSQESHIQSLQNKFYSITKNDKFLSVHYYDILIKRNNKIVRKIFGRACRVKEKLQLIQFEYDYNIKGR